jgi:hypothetical protein
MSTSKATDDGSNTTTIGPQSVEVEMTGIDDRVDAEDPPAVKQEAQTREEQESSFSWQQISRLINDQLAMAMPPQTKVDVHDLRKTGLAQLITIAFVAAYLIALIYNSVMGHRQLRNEAFLSPDLYAGECNEVPLAITSVYESDSNGKWDTQAGFVPTLSMYALDLRGTKVTNDEYPEVMQDFQEKFRAQADKNAKRDLSYNMVTLASYNLANNHKQISIFTNARAEKVFGSVVFASALSNQYGRCWGSYATYDAASGTINYNIDFKYNDTLDYYEGNMCTQVHPSDFSSDDIDDNGMKSLKFDIRSIATAVSINLGLTRLSEDLAMIRPPQWYYDYYQEVFVQVNISDDAFSRYVDPYYEDMTPIYCYNGYKFGKKDYCLLEGERGDNYLTHYYYPMITQFGHWGKEMMCTCGEQGTIKTEENMESFCSEADFLVSLVYVPSKQPAPEDYSFYFYGGTYGGAYGSTPPPTEAPTEAPTDAATQNGYYYFYDSGYNIITFAESISKIWDDNPEDGDLLIAQRFHPAQFRSVFGGGMYKAFDALCEGKCSMFTIEFWGDSSSPMNSRGTPVYMMFNQTRMTACSNGLYREEAFAPLFEPPVTLVQAYYTCILNNTVAIQRAVGIAAGSSALYATVVLNVLLISAIYGYNYLYDDKIINPALKKKIIEDDIAQLKSALNNQIAESKNELAELKTVIQSNQKIIAELQKIIATK